MTHPVAAARHRVAATAGVAAALALRAVLAGAAWIAPSALMPTTPARRRACIAAAAFEHCPGGMAVSDDRGVLLAVNSTMTRWCAASARSLVGSHLSELVEPGDGAVLLAALGAAPGGREEVQVRLAGGQQRWVRLTVAHIAPSGGQGGMCVIQVEDAGAQRATTQRLAHDAAHDALTGLPNRRALSVELADLIENPGAGGALVIIDLDGFKAVNDRHGHAGGDELLRVVADRLTSCLRPGDVAGRLGGDELMVIARGVVDDAGARALGDRVLAAVLGPARLAGGTVLLRASIGIRRINPGEGDALALVRDADAALYRAKAQGGCRARLAQVGEGHQSAPADPSPLAA